MFEIDGQLFDWDENKYKINVNKHGISFKEAASVFFDENAVEVDDDEHSQHEERFLIIGRSKRLRLMVVCHCYRENNTIIRIISARKANDTEKEIYGGDNHE